MAKGEAASVPLSLLKREHVLKAIELLDAGRDTKFAESTKYDLLYLGKRYPPKRVAGLALEVLTDQPSGPYMFKGGQESACFRALERAGFSIVPKLAAAASTFPAAVASVLQLQTQWSGENTEAMQRRGELIRKELPSLVLHRIADLEPLFSRAGYAVSVEASDGIGRKVQTPWVRIHDALMSPAATQGWYIVLHFSLTGDAFFLTLGCGSTQFKGGSFVALDETLLRQRVAWARAVSATPGFRPERFLDEIKLNGNELSRQFERATAYARRYEAGQLQKAEFWDDLRELTARLITIYDAQRQGSDPAARGLDLAAMEQAVEEAISPKKVGRGQGRGLTGPERVAVERQAMAVAHEGLVAAGFTNIQDTSASASYDFSAHRDGKEWLIEVKGTTSAFADQFLLTAAELRLHLERKGSTALAIVTGIQLSRVDGTRAHGGALILEVPWDPHSWKFEPTAYRAVRAAS